MGIITIMIIIIIIKEEDNIYTQTYPIIASYDSAD